MILLKQDLEHEYRITDQEMNQELQSSKTFLSWLESKRDEKLEEQFKMQKQRALSFATMHSKSEDFRRQLIQTTSSPSFSSFFDDKSALTSSMIEFSAVSMSTSLIDIFHVIFCLDESGSMTTSDWKALMKSYLEFLKIFQNRNDKFSVIQFAFNSRVVYKSLRVDEAITYPLSKGTGGTEFTPPLDDLDRILSNDVLATKYLVIFMTDGDNTDQHSTLKIAKQLDSKYSSKMEFYGVGFKEINKLKNLPALVNCFRNGHLVRSPTLPHLLIPYPPSPSDALPYLTF